MFFRTKAQCVWYLLKLLRVMCHDCGVALVYTRQLPKAPISGASRWFRQTPLIQLSDRFKTADQFWFSFFHEAGHIILHGKKDIFLEDLKGTLADKNKEEEANNYAASLLLPETELQEILASQPLTTEIIRGFAQKFSVPAGIIGEPYFDVDFSRVFYLTDTGRRWDGDAVSVRDKVKSEVTQKAFCLYFCLSKKAKMDALIEKFKKKIAQVSTVFSRSLMDKIDWNARLIQYHTCIKTPMGSAVCKKPARRITKII